MQRFGEKLHTLREQRGLTLRALAQALGYTAHAHLGLIEQGKRQPSLEVVLRVAAYFEVSADQLMRDDLEVAPEVTRTDENS